MFNLESSITNWRRQMQAAGIQTPAHLDELENHLREDVAQQMAAGLAPERAFAAAVRALGRMEALKTEFKKTGAGREWRLVKVLGLGGCAFASLFSLVMSPGFLTIHELSRGQRLAGFAAVAVTVLSLFSGRFSYKFLPVIRNSRTRLAAGLACAVAGLVWMLVFIQSLSSVIVPHLFSPGDSAESFRGSVLIGLKHATAPGFGPIFTLAILLLWAIAVTAVLGGLAYGLEETARRHNQTTTA